MAPQLLIKSYVSHAWLQELTLNLEIGNLKSTGGAALSASLATTPPTPTSATAREAPVPRRKSRVHLSVPWGILSELGLAAKPPTEDEKQLDISHAATAAVAVAGSAAAEGAAAAAAAAGPAAQGAQAAAAESLGAAEETFAAEQFYDLHGACLQDPHVTDMVDAAAEANADAEAAPMSGEDTSCLETSLGKKGWGPGGLIGGVYSTIGALFSSWQPGGLAGEGAEPRHEVAEGTTDVDAADTPAAASADGEPVHAVERGIITRVADVSAAGTAVATAAGAAAQACSSSLAEQLIQPGSAPAAAAGGAGGAVVVPVPQLTTPLVRRQRAPAARLAPGKQTLANGVVLNPALKPSSSAGTSTPGKVALQHQRAHAAAATQAGGALASPLTPQNRGAGYRQPSPVTPAPALTFSSSRAAGSGQVGVGSSARGRKGRVGGGGGLWVAALTAPGAKPPLNFQAGGKPFSNSRRQVGAAAAAETAAAVLAAAAAGKLPGAKPGTLRLIQLMHGAEDQKVDLTKQPAHVDEVDGDCTQGQQHQEEARMGVKQKPVDGSFHGMDGQDQAPSSSIKAAARYAAGREDTCMRDQGARGAAAGLGAGGVGGGAGGGGGGAAAGGGAGTGAEGLHVGSGAAGADDVHGLLLCTEQFRIDADMVMGVTCGPKQGKQQQQLREGKQQQLEQVQGEEQQGVLPLQERLQLDGQALGYLQQGRGRSRKRGQENRSGEVEKKEGKGLAASLQWHRQQEREDKQTQQQLEGKGEGQPAAAGSLDEASEDTVSLDMACPNEWQQEEQRDKQGGTPQSKLVSGARREQHAEAVAHAAAGTAGIAILTAKPATAGTGFAYSGRHSSALVAAIQVMQGSAAAVAQSRALAAAAARAAAEAMVPEGAVGAGTAAFVSQVGRTQARAGVCATTIATRGGLPQFAAGGATGAVGSGVAGSFRAAAVAVPPMPSGAGIVRTMAYVRVPQYQLQQLQREHMQRQQQQEQQQQQQQGEVQQRGGAAVAPGALQRTNSQQQVCTRGIPSRQG